MFGIKRRPPLYSHTPTQMLDMSCVFPKYITFVLFLAPGFISLFIHPSFIMSSVRVFPPFLLPLLPLISKIYELFSATAYEIAMHGKDEIVNENFGHVLTLENVVKYACFSWYVSRFPCIFIQRLHNEKKKNLIRLSQCAVGV